MKKKNLVYYISAGVLLLLIAAFSVSAFKNAISSKNRYQTKLDKPFSAKATIKMKDMTMETDINKTDIGACTIKVTNPESLKDMQFQYNGEDVKVTYKGLSVSLDENNKLVSSVASALVKTIDAAASPKGVNAKVKGNALHVTGKGEAGDFDIVLDKKTGGMVSLSLPQLDFECDFKDFMFAK